MLHIKFQFQNYNNKTQDLNNDISYLLCNLSIIVRIGYTKFSMAAYNIF